MSMSISSNPPTRKLKMAKSSWSSISQKDKRHCLILPRFHPHYDPLLLEYSAVDVSKTVGQHSQKAIAHMYSVDRIFMNTPIPTTGTEEKMAQIVESWFGALDRTFFYSLLTKQIAVEVKHRPNVDWWGLYKPNTVSQDSRGIRSTGIRSPANFSAWKPTININTQGLPGSFRNQIKALVGTLLHEMLHAFIDLYSCQCLETCLDLNKEQEAIGISGHADAWSTAMVQLQQALESEVGWEVDVNLDMSLKLEQKMRKRAQRQLACASDESSSSESSDSDSDCCKR